jgi:hypothetical protein
MTDPLRLPSDVVQQMILATEPWLSCDDCFDDLDAVVEGALTRTGTMNEAFRVHLLGCSVCREEATSLATLVAPDHDLDPSRAAALLESAVNNGANGATGSDTTSARP